MIGLSNLPGGRAGGRAVRGGFSYADEGFDLALGLANNLDEFAKSTKSLTYVQKTGTIVWDEVPFTQVASQARRINFNMGSQSGSNLFSIKRYADWQRRGQPFEPGMKTNYELNYILSNPDILKKTNFFVFPSR